MARLSSDAQNELAFRLIDTITEASSGEVIRVLKLNGFAEEFPYGDNPQKAATLLERLYVGNRKKFLELVKSMNIDYTKISPQERDAYLQIARTNDPNAQANWLNSIWDMISPSTTTGGGEETVEETTGGAYVAYAIIIIAIIGITVYLFKTVK